MQPSGWLGEAKAWDIGDFVGDGGTEFNSVAVADCPPDAGDHELGPPAVGIDVRDPILQRAEGVSNFLDQLRDFTGGG